VKTNIRAKYSTTATALLSVGHREVYRSKKGLLMNWDKIKETKAYQRFSVFARSNFEYVMRKDYWEIDVCIVNGEKFLQTLERKNCRAFSKDSSMNRGYI